MDLALSDEQAMFAETLRRLLCESYDFEHRRALLRAGPQIDSDLWGSLVELGAFGLFVSEEAGGFGGTLLEAGILAQQLGMMLVAEPVIACAMAPARLFARLGLEDALRRVLNGERHALVDLRHMWSVGDTVTADIGSVEGGGGADLLILADDRSLYRVASSDAGLSVREFRQLDGRTAADLCLVGARAERLADGAAEAFALARSEAAVAELWYEFGSMKAALAGTVSYMQERRQFGRTLSQFQTVQHNVAEMAVACEEARAAAWLAALSFETASDAGGRVRALAGGKIQLARTARIVAETAVQLHGGMGVCEELPIASHYRQMLAFRARYGTPDVAIEDMAEAVVRSGRFGLSAVLGHAA